MMDRVRDALYRAMTTPLGDKLVIVRLPKDLARRINTTLGSPLATRAELAKRARAHARLEELRNGAKPAPVRRGVAAPVLVYFEKDRNARELVRIEELLGAKAIAWTRLDVAGDEATIAFVMNKAGCERDELPVVFVADKPIGGYQALVEADVSGELARAIMGGGA